MGVLVTAVAGLCLWIVMWALNVSGFDGILIAISFTLLAIAAQEVGPHLSGSKEAH